MWQGTPERIAELRAMAQRVREAAPETLGALYAEWIGYDPTQEGACFPTLQRYDLDELRGDLRDYIAEICYAEGIHCSEVFEEGE